MKRHHKKNSSDSGKWVTEKKENPTKKNVGRSHPLSGRTRFHSHRVLFIFHDFPFVLRRLQKAKYYGKFSFNFKRSMFSLREKLPRRAFSDPTEDEKHQWIRTKVFQPLTEFRSFHQLHKAMPFGLMLCSFWIWKHFLLWHFYHYLYFVVGSAPSLSCIVCAAMLLWRE